MFDKIKKQVSVVGGQVADLAGTAKSRAEMLKLDAEIVDLYRKAGKKAYEDYRSGKPIDCLEFFSQITEKMDRIEVLKTFN